MQKTTVSIEDGKEIRINKYLSDVGICSRREADKLIESGIVAINNKTAKLGSKVKAGDIVEVKVEQKPLEYFAYYKPKGEITGPVNRMPNMHPVGRLDKESEGILIYTNDHTLVDDLLNPKNKIEKEYNVKVREKATPRVKRLLELGIVTQEESYDPAKLVSIDEEDARNIKIILTEGKKHEIRRMLNALNLTIDSLKRVRIQNMRIKNMRPKEIRKIERSEIL